MSANILVVEDNAGFSELLATILKDDGHMVTIATDGDEGLRRIRQERFDLVLSDLKMPVKSGLELFRETRQDAAPPLFIFITAFGKVEEAVAAIKEGAFDFLTKPLKDPRSLRDSVKRALESVERERLFISLKDMERSGLPPDELIFSGSAMDAVRKMIYDVAPSTATVLIHGESGTGKELVARMIHLLSKRKGAAFIPLNCAAIPENLLESELFGHEKGAFTGAMQARRGKFELAEGGTIFLDEIGEMPALLQAKLLRVLQERVFERVGGSMQIRTNVRVIAATNRDLNREVAEKRFRDDLFYRLNVFPITVPPLRARLDALAGLARYFCAQFAVKTGKKLKGITPEALRLMKAYHWPGNIRELQNVIERGVILAREELTAAELPAMIAEKESEGGPKVGILKDIERNCILEALKNNRGNRRMAAETLGISKRTLQYRLKELGLVAGKTEITRLTPTTSTREV